MLREEVIREWEELKSKIPRYYQSQLTTIYQNWTDSTATIIPDRIITLEELVKDSQKRGQEWRELFNFRSQVIHQVLGNVNPLEISDEQVLQVLRTEEVEEPQLVNYCQHCEHCKEGPTIEEAD